MSTFKDKFVILFEVQIETFNEENSIMGFLWNRYSNWVMIHMKLKLLKALTACQHLHESIGEILPRNKDLWKAKLFHNQIHWPPIVEPLEIDLPIPGITLESASIQSTGLVQSKKILD